MEFKHFRREKSKHAWDAPFSNQFVDYRLKLKHFITRHDGLDPIEDHEYCEHYFSQLIKGYEVTDIVIALDDNNEVIGFVWGKHGQIGTVRVPLAFRRRKLATEMLQLYMKQTELTAESYSAFWDSEDVATTRLFVSLGFTVTFRHEVMSSSMLRTVATKAGSDAFHEKRLEADRGYFDFRGDHAVVDGHYTLDQLESLLVLARKELKSGD